MIFFFLKCQEDLVPFKQAIIVKYTRRWIKKIRAEFLDSCKL